MSIGSPSLLAAVFIAVTVASSPGATGAATPAGPSPAVAAPPAPVRYQVPVVAEVVDPFRLPAHPYGAGNRGLDYATAPGQVVSVAAEGVVAFAGPVGGRLVVSVDHADGLRTTYTGLARVTVRRGRRLAAGSPVGVAGRRLHFGVRAGAAYLDPRHLFAAEAGGRVRLVPLASVSSTPGSGRRGAPLDSRRSDIVSGLARGSNHHHLSPPSVASGRSAAGFAEPKEGDQHGPCRHLATAARGRCALRTPDSTLEPQDEALHPR